jgi:protein SCO1/2
MIRWQMAVIEILTACLLAGCSTLDGSSRSGAALRTNSAGYELPPSAQSVDTLEDIWETDGGERVRLADYKGGVRVISMFYATCEGICGVTRDDMKALEASLKGSERAKVKFILVTFDGQRDGPAALRTYRAENALPASRWILLRGGPASTERLASRLGVDFGKDRSGRFIHSSQLVLVRGDGKIIGSYSGLRADLGSIAKEIERALAVTEVSLR